MAQSIGDFLVLRETIGEVNVGNKFTGIRVYAIPTDLVSTYRSQTEPSDENIWPGTATTWQATTDYVVDDEVQGDGNPDTLIYKSILASGPGGVGAKEPPDTTYWKREQHSPYIKRNKEEQQFPGRPGMAKVTVWYGKPSTRRILRDNLNKAIMEVDISAESVQVVREPAKQAEWDATTVYGSGARAKRKGIDYKSRGGGNQNHAPPNAKWWEYDSQEVRGIVGGVAWHAGHAFGADEIVRYDGTVYKAVAGSSGVTPGTDGTKWKVYEAKWTTVVGSCQALLPNARVRLRSATSSLSLETHFDMIGTTNDAVLPNFGNAQPNTLLFVGFWVKKVLTEGDVWDELFTFLWHPDGWDGRCTVQMLKKQIIEVTAKDENGINIPINGTSRVVAWFPDGDAESRDVTKGESSFFDFNASLTW